jgi:hypothetical protein
VGFSSGISLDIQLPKNFYLRTGLNYWNIGDKNTTVLKNVHRDSATATYTVKADIPVSGFNGTPLYTFDSSSTSYQTYTVAANSPGVKISANNNVTNVKESISQYSSIVQNNYQYLGIPMVLGVKLGRSALSLGMYSGVITNVLLSPHKTVLYVYYQDSQPGHYIQSTRELTRFSLVYWGGLDVDIKLSPQWTLNVSPNIKYSLTSIYKGEQSMKQLPYSMGLQFGVRYLIK